ncbi:MAG TPA: DJ-1/PfpI family protein [Solirubrobacterales bacterium]|jgi:transcriptional regulator GlxA family with amidase domain
MQTAILVFDRLTALDAVGPYEVLRRAPGWKVQLVGPTEGVVRDERGALGLAADRSLDEVTDADILLVPGGIGTRPLMEDEQLLSWLREVDGRTKWTASVCTGSLLLGAAGLLDGKRATTHWLSLERLAELGAIPVEERVVEDGKVITAAGVSAGIDMALRLVARELGSETARRIQLSIEYDPEPPFDAGSPRKAPAEVVEAVTAAAARHDEWLRQRL